MRGHDHRGDGRLRRGPWNGPACGTWRSATVRSMGRSAGRDQACPCGSGRIYRRCCGAHRAGRRGWEVAGEAKTASARRVAVFRPSRRQAARMNACQPNASSRRRSPASPRRPPSSRAGGAGRQGRLLQEHRRPRHGPVLAGDMARLGKRDAGAARQGRDVDLVGEDRRGLADPRLVLRRGLLRRIALVHDVLRLGRALSSGPPRFRSVLSRSPEARAARSPRGPGRAAPASGRPGRSAAARWHGRTPRGRRRPARRSRSPAPGRRT